MSKRKSKELNRASTKSKENNVNNIEYKNTREITNKWPGMIVQGDNVTKEQAAEILLRTDLMLPNFRYGCNDKEFIAQVQSLFPLVKEGDDGLSWSEAYQVIGLGYLWNSRIMSSWVGGPNGWCNWDGTIGSSNKNIGKWPSVQDVAEEWAAIAQAFPFLNLRCQLFSDETCEEEAEPILLFTVSDGKVLVEDSDEELGGFDEPNYMSMFLGRNERGITIPELKEKIKMVYGW